MSIIDEFTAEELEDLSKKIDAAKRRKRLRSSKKQCSVYNFLRNDDISIYNFFFQIMKFRNLHDGGGKTFEGEISFVDEDKSYCIITVKEPAKFRNTKVFISFMHPIKAVEKVLGELDDDVLKKEDLLFSEGEYVKFNPRIGLTGLYVEKANRREPSQEEY